MELLHQIWLLILTLWVDLAVSSLTCPASAGPVDYGFKLLCAVDTNRVRDLKSGFFSGNTIPPFLCTHITLHFAGIDDIHHKLWFDPLLGGKGKAVADQVKELKRMNPNLRMLFSIGGWGDNENPAKYMKLMQQQAQNFANSVLERLRLEVIYDGIEFHYDHAGRHDLLKADDERSMYANFTEILCSTLRPENYLCVMTIIRPFKGLQNETKTALAFKKIMHFADYVIPLTANMPETEDEFKQAYHTDMLYPPENENVPNYKKIAAYSTASMMERFLNFSDTLEGPNACLRQKILYTVPMQGNGYPRTQLNPTTAHGQFVREHPWPRTWDDSTVVPPPPPLGMGVGIEYVSDALVQVSFVEVCYRERFRELNDDKLFVASHYTYTGGVQSDPVAYNGNQVIPTNTPESVREKVKYAKKMGFGGVHSFHIDYDDSRGWCYNQTYPLLHAMHEAAYEDCNISFNFPGSCPPNNFSQPLKRYRPWDEQGSA